MSPNRAPARPKRPSPAQARLDAEVRELHATVGALRDELDRAPVDESTRLHQAAAAAQSEMQTMRETVQAQEELNRALARASDENRQLHETANALRAQLDELAHNLRDELAKREGDWRGQLLEAQNTLVALRTELDRKHEATVR
jgi:chromosome segregation ATPase